MPADDVVRIERKGRKKFAFGAEGAPFEVDVVVAFYDWVDADNKFRGEDRTIPDDQSKAYNEAAVAFVQGLMMLPDKSGDALKDRPDITTAEALDFIARLREQYEACADFFRPKLGGERDSPDTSQGTELRFMEEAS